MTAFIALPAAFGPLLCPIGLHLSRPAISSSGSRHEPRMNETRPPKVNFVSLGCPKALGDSERIITRLRAEGYELARKHEGSDLAIVNTCGFLDTAKAESLSAI